MGKKPESAAGQAVHRESPLGKPLKDDLAALYAKYGEAETQDQMKDLAVKLAEAWRDQNATGAAKGKKVQAAE